MSHRPPICHHGHRHRTWRTYIRCTTRTAAWVRGHGRWALLAHCRTLTVSLHRSQPAACRSRRWLDRYGCGSECFGAHQIVRLRDDQEAQR